MGVRQKERERKRTKEIKVIILGHIISSSLPSINNARRQVIIDEYIYGAQFLVNIFNRISFLLLATIRSYIINKCV